MMNILFCYLVINLAAYFDIGSDTAFPKTMIPFEEYFFR